MRKYVQYGFLAFNIYIGLRLYLFYSHYMTAGATPFVSRPPSVEAYLPIAALMSLKYFLVTGVIDPVHPAGLIILVAAIMTTLVLRRGFCSWICPIGTLSEICHRVGKRLEIIVKPPRFIDLPLRSLKYILLAAFVMVTMQMDVLAIRAYMSSPFNRIADIKMLLFFKNLSLTGVLVLFNLVVLSVIIKNFWCRYLCPYGAMLALFSKAGLTRIERDAEKCIDCNKCDRACPSYIGIAKAPAVTSVECIGCLDCVSACPVADTLEVKVAGKKRIEPDIYGVLLVGVFLAIIVAAQLTGHWQTNITSAEYKQRIPEAMSPFYTRP